MGSEHDFAVIAARIARGGINDQEAELARKGALRQVRHRHGMAVIPACAAGLRRQAVKQRVARWNDGRPFFRRSILSGGQVKPMPVNEIGIAAVIDDVDCYRLPLLEPQRRAGDGAVVSRGLDNLAWRYLKRNGRDADCLIGLLGRRLRLGFRKETEARTDQ
jgi:hypothetical protein